MSKTIKVKSAALRKYLIKEAIECGWKLVSAADENDLFLKFNPYGRQFGTLHTCTGGFQTVHNSHTLKQFMLWLRNNSPAKKYPLTIEEAFSPSQCGDAVLSFTQEQLIFFI